MKNILVLGAGWEQEPLVQRIFNNTNNCKVYCVHYDDQYLNYPFDEVLISDLRNHDIILNFAQEKSIDAVISDQDDFALTCQAAISEFLGIPGPNTYQALISSNKYLQRNKCKQEGILHPPFALVWSIGQIRDFGENVGYPLIIKPIDNRGSIGVAKIGCEDQVEDAFWNSFRQSTSNMLIVEKFIKGQEVTVDGYCFDSKPNSLAVASKGKLSEGLQVSFEIEYPGMLDRHVVEKLKKNNEIVCQRLGYTFGMTHAEYIIDEKNDIYLVEAANRGGGCFTSEIIVPNHSGVDLVAHLINDAIGESFVSNNDLEPGNVLLKFVNFRPGVVRSIKGLEGLNDSREVLQYRINIKEGDKITEVSNDANRHGFIILKANSEIRILAEKYLKQIQIEYYE